MRPRAIAILSLAVVLGVTAAAPAGAAAHAQRRAGRSHRHAGPARPSRLLGRVPVRGRHPRARSSAASPLIYQGSSSCTNCVMHRNHVHAIYWFPSGSSFDPGYRATIDAYLGNVAADSHANTNVYSTTAQYTDAAGPAAYDSSFVGSVVDTSPFPLSGCTDSATPAICLTDAQIQTEIDRVISATPGWTRGPDSLFLLFTPRGVGSCGDATTLTDCAFISGGYCAYHSWFGNGSGLTLYANMPYGATDPTGCGTGQSPQGNADADAETSLVSHEHAETITDPTAQGWVDGAGQENGDKCVGTFGPVAGPAGAGYNQTIAGQHYYLQQEWSNAVGGCASSGPLVPTARFAAQPSAFTGEDVGFDATSSVPAPGQTIDQATGYSWNFGDTTTVASSGPLQHHTFTAPGVYTVTVTVTESDGQTATVSHNVTASAPPPPTASFTATPSYPATGEAITFDGRASSDSHAAIPPDGYHWDFGDGQTAVGAVATHAYSTAGTRTVTLTVTDPNGASSPARRSVLVLDRPPIASFVARGNTAGSPVVFDASPSSDPDGRVVAYLWDFGDGSSASGSSVSHAFSAGTHRVTLSVIDDSQSEALASALLDIRAPSSAPGPRPADATVRPSSSRATTSLLVPRQRLGEVLRHGLVVWLGQTTASHAEVRLLLDPRTARRLRLSSRRSTSAVEAGSATSRVPAGLTTVVVRLRRSVARRLRGAGPLTMTVLISSLDGDGASTSRRLRVRLG